MQQALSSFLALMAMASWLIPMPAGAAAAGNAEATFSEACSCCGGTGDCCMERAPAEKPSPLQNALLTPTLTSSCPPPASMSLALQPCLREAGAPLSLEAPHDRGPPLYLFQRALLI